LQGRLRQQSGRADADLRESTWPTPTFWTDVSPGCEPSALASTAFASTPWSSPAATFRPERRLRRRLRLGLPFDDSVVLDDSCDEFPFAGTYEGGTDGGLCAEIVPQYEDGAWYIHQADDSRPVTGERLATMRPNDLTRPKEQH
jgi:hypothetical protein